MGFSVSASFAIFLVGFLVLASVAYTSLSNGMNLVSEGRNEQNNRMSDELQTDINITNVNFNSGTLTVEIKNTGSVVLNSSSTDLLINGTIQTENISYSPVKVWIPDKTLTVTITSSTGTPSRVKAVTENGISSYWED